MYVPSWPFCLSTHRKRNYFNEICRIVLVTGVLECAPAVRATQESRRPPAEGLKLAMVLLMTSFWFYWLAILIIHVSLLFSTPSVFKVASYSIIPAHNLFILPFQSASVQGLAFSIRSMSLAISSQENILHCVSFFTGFRAFNSSSCMVVWNAGRPSFMVGFVLGWGGKDFAYCFLRLGNNESLLTGYWRTGCSCLLSSTGDWNSKFPRGERWEGL